MQKMKLFKKLVLLKSFFVCKKDFADIEDISEIEKESAKSKKNRRNRKRIGEIEKESEGHLMKSVSTMNIYEIHLNL